MEEVSGYFKSLGLPGAMTLLMLVVYRVLPQVASDRVKTLVVFLGGIVLSVVWQAYWGISLNFKCVIDCFFYGIQLGATAIGLYKGGQAVGLLRYNEKGGGDGGGK